MSNLKETGIQWFPKIKSEWKVGKIKEVFDISKELSTKISPTVLSLARAEVKIRDVSNNEGQLAASYENYNTVEVGDLLLNPMDLYSGANCNVSYVEGVISPAYINLRAKTKMEPRYYDFYFKIQYWTMAMFAHGKGVSFDNRWTINNETLLNYEIPIPTFEEQVQIVSVLDKKINQIEALISNQEKQIEILNEYKQAIITKVVTKGLNEDEVLKDSGVEWMGKIPSNYKMISMKYLGVVRNGLTYSPEDITSEDKGTLVLRSSNIQNGKIVYDDNVYVSSIIKDDLIVKKNDILICSRNGSKKLIGKNVIIEEDNGYSFGAFMMIFRPYSASKYLYYILNSSIFSFYLGTYLTSTINQLTGSNFNNMIVPFCEDPVLQNKIVEYLDRKCSKIESLLEIKYKKIEMLQEYKKSVIYEYVTGIKQMA